MELEKLSQTDLAYFAGIFDGEGTIGLTRRTSSMKGTQNSPAYRIYLVVGNTNKRLIDDLYEAFGGWTMPYTGSNPNRKPFWRWETGGASCLPIVQVLRPYLRLKQRQADLVIAFEKNRQHLRVRGTRGVGTHKVSEEESNFRHERWLELRLLNQRGVTIHPVRTISREGLSNQEPSETTRRPPRKRVKI